jgi:hypothetical protein
MMATVLALMLAVPGSAFAQSPVGDAYGGTGVLDDVERIPPSQPGEEAESGTPPSVDREAGAPGPSTGTSLPFTGLDIGLLALGGVAMLGVGVGLRRLSRATA